MLASTFLEKLKNLDFDQLKNIKGLGDVLVSNLQEFTQSKSFNRQLEKWKSLERQGNQLNIKDTINSSDSNLNLPLTGEVICITGTFEQPRSQIQQQLQELGAKTVDSITKQTTSLLCGENAGSKLDKAKQQNIAIFYNLESLIQTQSK